MTFVAILCGFLGGCASRCQEMLVLTRLPELGARLPSAPVSCTRVMAASAQTWPYGTVVDGAAFTIGVELNAGTRDLGPAARVTGFLKRN